MENVPDALGGFIKSSDIPLNRSKKPAIEKKTDKTKNTQKNFWWMDLWKGL